ncbi:peptide deformylase [Rubinisphaera sp.]|uniref:peptide deformylase n=1 Tax=Rubinisphaera sp. TaxID=2024857 RepID=UPI000C0E8F75|nr:peptide deformylase [Rubinisphaera sp.]MBV08639.1 peptide deformylase [Rubinisphaera sp.]HCS51939.1 peptide deformylase [Planctomycetaceae bacterium]|tara:strand:- start:20059 stop:20637 length:579 start_codon:yes stop_codon:yes gene_type:complete
MEIVLYPHPALHFKSAPVREIDAKLRKTVEEMFELMYAANGIGLAANQVALPYQLFIINLTADPDQKDEEIVFINPNIKKRRGQVTGEEGCLSFPELYGPVERSKEITVEAYNLKGQLLSYDLDDLASRAVQHENDHIEGVLFIDRMTKEEREKVAPVVDDFERQFRDAQAREKTPSDAELLKELKKLAAGS